MNFFTLFTMPIVFLRHFYMIYVETAFHVTVPLKLFEIFCVDFVRVSGSRCILRIYETRTEWVISAYFLKDLGLSNVLHSLIRVEILQYLCKSWRKYHRIDTDASFLGSIHTQNSIDVVLWFQFCQKISLMSYCGSISAKKLYWCHVVG